MKHRSNVTASVYSFGHYAAGKRRRLTRIVTVRDDETFCGSNRKWQWRREEVTEPQFIGRRMWVIMLKLVETLSAQARNAQSVSPWIVGDRATKFVGAWLLFETRK
jgi:hypothetical protein